MDLQLDLMMMTLMNSKLNLVILECVNVFSKRYKNYLLQTISYLGNSEFVALDKLNRVGGWCSSPV